MTIYIYGSKSFKNNIHEVLEHANMKFRLDDEDSIVEISSLHKLKEAIEEDPKNIFLIDDEKIIKKNSLNDKIKFLKPKGGIEEEFLREYGIGDLSVDDIEDIATHVIRKLEKVHAQKEVSSEEDVKKQNDTSFLTPDHDKTSLKEIEDKEELESFVHDDDDFDINEVLDFDEEESSLTSNYKNDEKNSEEESTSIIKNEEEILEEDFELTIEEIEKKRKNDMADEFSELDNLSEK